MDRAKAESLIISIANFNGVDPDLACAIAEVESSFNEFAVRYEINWKYVYNAESFARQSFISEATEMTLQKCSFGLMQVMGTVARELGFRGNLLELTKPEVGARFGCLKIKELMQKYNFQDDLIAAYNSGTPKKGQDGKYTNDIYVKKVRSAFVNRKF